MRIGRYELERPLARGGMAELFVARLDEGGFARRVAIKQALPELARDPGFAAMFRAEAELAASLAHHNIVAVHDLGADFLVMELLHGADVGAILRAAPGPIPTHLVAAIASDACAGLHHAHERFGADGVALGIVHRDVSPQNLFVTFDGCTKLLDFGIAKAIDQIGNRDTRTGTLRGKVPYMSPEQCRGEKLDRRTDVFSLGIVLWELVTGERLYGALGESDFEVFKQIADRDAPDPIAKRPDLSPAFAQVILRALARDREARYPTIAAMHDELDRLPRATARDVGAYVAALFPVRAEAWKRGTLEAAPQGPRVTAPLPAQAASVATPGLIADEVTHIPTTAPAPARWKMPVAIGAVAVALAGGYAVGMRREASAQSPSPAPVPPTPVVVGQPAIDAQWFQPDDFLVTEQPYQGRRLDYVNVGKLVGPAPSAPDAPARFVDPFGHELETKTYWQTRMATAADMVIGQLAFCHAPPNSRDGSTPANRDDARNGNWTVARITDLSLMPEHVGIGDAVCPLAAVRVPR